MKNQNSNQKKISTLIQVMNKDPEVKERILELLHLSPYERRFELNIWLEKLGQRNASENLCHILLILFDDMVKDSEKVLIDVEDFLGLKHYIPPRIGEKVNVTKQPRYKILPKMNTSLMRFKQTRAGRHIWRIIPMKEHMNRFMLYVLNKSKVPRPKPKIEEKTRKFLRHYYREDILKLEKLIKRDLSNWR